jgi:hypothetical protein
MKYVRVGLKHLWQVVSRLILGPVFFAYAVGVIIHVISTVVGFLPLLLASILGVSWVGGSSLETLGLYAAAIGGVGGFGMGVKVGVEDLSKKYSALGNLLSSVRRMLGGLFASKKLNITVEYRHSEEDLQCPVPELQRLLNRKQMIPRVGEHVSIDEELEGLLTQEEESGRVRSRRVAVEPKAGCVVEKVHYNPSDSFMHLVSSHDPAEKSTDVLVAVVPATSFAVEATEIREIE